jgi:hypothetical protein
MDLEEIVKKDNQKIEKEKSISFGIFIHIILSKNRRRR